MTPSTPMLCRYTHHSTHNPRLLIRRTFSTRRRIRTTSRGQATGTGCTPTRPPCSSLFRLLGIDALHVLFDFLDGQHLDGLAGRHDGDLDVLGARLHHFQQRFDRQPDRVLARHVRLVVALQELAHRFRRAPDRVGFPASEDAVLV